VDLQLKGKVAIVTGASKGIGRAIAHLLAGEGMRLVVVARSRDQLDALALPMGDACLVQAADLTNSTAPAAVVAAAVERFGGLDVLVNNAGRFLLKPITDTKDEEWDGLMTTNVRSVFVHCREALPRLVERGGGAIVNVSSISGVVGLPAQGAYCATKGAIAQITRQLAIEHAADGVRVNAIAPGAVDTNFVDAALAGAPDRAAARRDIGAAHPLGRMASPEEIARVMVFLASPEASFITGAVVMADGGYTAQ
jgi:NAD(P)-dependent dehydrogenase (short-subunit alcohol dehydrogenase family)